MGIARAKRGGQRSSTVQGDWFAWLPEEMDQLFDATRSELECSGLILNVTLDEALALCDLGQFSLAAERAAAFSDLFDRLSNRIRLVVRSIEDHGSHFGTLPNVTPLVPSNFRGVTAQRISFMSSLLARVVLRARTRFFHKLNSLGEIVEDLQKEVHGIVEDVVGGASLSPDDEAWRELEVRGYDLNTCASETTVVLKSFFCALPAEELEGFREHLISQVPAMPIVDPRRTARLQRK